MIRFWDAATLDPVGPPRSHMGGWPYLLFSQDGRQLVASNPTSDRQAELWDLSRPDLPGTDYDVQVWAELVTGWDLDGNGQVDAIGAAQWATRRTQLKEKELNLPGLP